MSEHASILDSIKLMQNLDPVEAGASNVANGSAIDMQGWSGCVGLLIVGNTDRTVDFKAQDSADGSTGWADIAGAASTQVSVTGDSKTYAVDVYRPTKRYIRFVRTSGAGGTATVVGAISIRYGPSGLIPPTQDATVGEIVRKQVN